MPLHRRRTRRPRQRAMPLHPQRPLSATQLPSTSSGSLSKSAGPPVLAAHYRPNPTPLHLTGRSISSWLPTTAAASTSHPPLHSLSIPLNSLAIPAFAQPLLGSNHLVLSFTPSAGGGLPSASGVTVGCKVYPIEGKGWEAYERLQRARIRAMDVEPQREVETEALRASHARLPLLGSCADDSPIALPPHTAQRSTPDDPESLPCHV
jgi:hypothetical protein